MSQNGGFFQKKLSKKNRVNGENVTVKEEFFDNNGSIIDKDDAPNEWKLPF